MRERRRQRQASGNQVTFAAQAIDIARPADMKYATQLISMSKGKSRTAWDWYSKLGQIRYAVSRSARVGGYAEIGVYKRTKSGEIGDQVTTGLAGEIAASFYSPYGGTRGLIERFLTLMAIPSDSYLIAADGGDGFDFVSADELKFPDATLAGNPNSGQAVTRITLPGGSGYGEGLDEERVSAANFIGRVWRPSSRFADLPDSPMGALDVECELLYLLTLGIRAKLMSRLASNGIVYIPSEVNEVRSAAPKGEPGEFHNNKVLDDVIRAAVYAARNPTSPEAAIPIFMSGPGINNDQFNHFILDQTLEETDMKLRAELRDSILTGLDIMPSNVKGSGATNHWGAWADSEDELRVAVRPNLETMCWALERLVLRKRMQDEGRKPGEIEGLTVWYDLSKAASHQNIAEDARQLADRLMVSPSAAREASGFEERHAPTDLEYIRQVGIATGDPYLATYGMSEAEKFDWTKIGSAKRGPNPDSQAPDSSSQPGKGNPGSPDNNKSKTPSRLRPVSGGN